MQVEGFVIRDLGLLASAIARPQTTVYGAEAYHDLWTKAAALLESLARNHALADGNKRLTLVLTDVFLGLNGWDLRDSPEHVDYVLAVCTGQMDLEESADHPPTPQRARGRRRGWRHRGGLELTPACCPRPAPMCR